MKALVLEVTGRKAVLLLPGGEMRTVRAGKNWRTGMEVSVKPYPLPKKKRRLNPHAVLGSMTACAAAFLIVFAGFRLLTGGHIDRQHPIGPLSSGQPAITSVPTETPAPVPTAALTPNPTPTASPAPMSPSPTPTSGKQTEYDDHHSGEKCDKCGQFGHDDDDCPEQICDECGQPGHDDDHCPEQICDECGQPGHDDDHCPEQICDECGQPGHDDDDCPEQICDECGQKGHDDDDCPEQICDECGQKGHDDDHCPSGHDRDHYSD